MSKKIHRVMNDVLLKLAASKQFDSGVRFDYFEIILANKINHNKYSYSFTIRFRPLDTHALT